MAVVDASVWVAWFLEKDEFHERAKSFFEKAIKKDEEIRIPPIAFVEVAGTISRVTGSAVLANRYLSKMREFGPEVWEFDDSLEQTASHLAATCAIRGADAVYVAVALQAADKLVTLDKEQRKRAASQIETGEP